MLTLLKIDSCFAVLVSQIFVELNQGASKNKTICQRLEGPLGACYSLGLV